jgi:LacI family transcriptional regulator
MSTTIKEVARLAGVSRGTVDRVIHNRPGVNPDLRRKILSILKEVEYTPNFAGRALVHSNRKYRIGVILSPDFNPFVEQVKQGIKEEADQIAEFGVELNIEVVRAFDTREQLSMLDSLYSSGISAIAIVPVDDSLIKEKIDWIVSQGIPVVTFNSDLQGCRRLCFIGQDNYKAGKTQGRLASMFLRKDPRPSKVLVISSTDHLTCHKERVKGFLEKISTYRNIEMIGYEENYDMDSLSRQITTQYLEKHNDISLIYLTGGGISGVAQALVEKNVAGKIYILCHDLIPKSLELLRAGIVDIVIGQDPFKQGALPIKILYEYLFLKKYPQLEFYHTGIEIFTSENCS